MINVTLFVFAFSAGFLAGVGMLLGAIVWDLREEMRK